jgi:uroporphyrinogen decarboxylase
MDITAVKERYPNLVVMGGINCYEPLCAFSEKEIAAETKRVIGTVGRNGRFILASSNSVHSDVKPENYRIVQQVRRETPLSYDE